MAADASRSPSFSADAIHVPPKRSSNGATAPIRPPPPRRATARSPDCSKTYGPRCEQTTRLFADKSRKQSQPVVDLTGSQEVLADELAAGLPHRLRSLGALEQLERPLGALLDAVDEVAGASVLDLQRDAAGPAPDD